MDISLIILGNAAVGKTNLTKRFVDDEYDETIQPTIGADFFTTMYNIDDTKISLKIWDSAG